MKNVFAGLIALALAGPALAVAPIPGSRTVQATFQWTASNAGTPVLIWGCKTVTATVTQTGGSLGTTIFFDFCNSLVQPNANDPTQWSTATPNGVQMHSGALSNCSVCGTVPDNVVAVSTNGYVWIKPRVESLGPSVTTITISIVGIN